MVLGLVSLFVKRSGSLPGKARGCKAMTSTSKKHMKMHWKIHLTTLVKLMRGISYSLNPTSRCLSRSWSQSESIWTLWSLKPTTRLSTSQNQFSTLQAHLVKSRMKSSKRYLNKISPVLKVKEVKRISQTTQRRSQSPSRSSGLPVTSMTIYHGIRMRTPAQTEKLSRDTSVRW